MNRCSFFRPILPLVALLIVASSSACLAVYPHPDSHAALQMHQGWFDDNLAWYICTDASNIRYAQTQNLTLTPKLDSAYLIAPPVYNVVNPAATQGPVFSTRPGQPAYSGIWTYWDALWTDLAARAPLTSEAQILAAAGAGDLLIAPSDPRNVVDCPIVALGRLGGVWLAKPDPPFYRIPQAFGHDPLTNTIFLPAWNVFCTDEITKALSIRQVIIPDAGDPALATFLGANLAPGLLTIPLSDTQRFWVMRSPKPPSQLPVDEFCFPGFATDWGHSRSWTPVKRYVILHRNIPPWTVVNNTPFLESLVASGGLIVVQANQMINAPIQDPPADAVTDRRLVTMNFYDWGANDGDTATLRINGANTVQNHLLTPFPGLVIGNFSLKKGKNVIEIIGTGKGSAGDCTVGLRISNVIKGTNDFQFTLKVAPAEVRKIIVEAP